MIIVTVVISYHYHHYKQHLTKIFIITLITLYFNLNHTDLSIISGIQYEVAVFCHTSVSP